MICATCKQPIDEGQLYHYALRADDLEQVAAGARVQVLFDPSLPVHEYPCPARMEIVDGHLFVGGVDMGDFSHLVAGVQALPAETESQWLERQQTRVKAYQTGSVLKWHDGSIAYRTNRPAEDADAWLIICPDGTTVGAGYVTVTDMDPLYNWSPMEATR